MTTRWLCSACVLVVVACGDNQHGDELVVTVAEPPGANCAAGGVAIETGVDLNNDGVLEPSEVTNISYVCSATSTPNELVKVVPEPPGANCANGGEAVEIGFDTNGDGVLEAGEIVSTSYVCAGTNGEQTLIRVDPEAAGPNCANGGEAIHTGLDTNGDGILEDSEITSTSYVCAGANGAQPLVRVDPEPPGPNCANGGEAIHTGLDTNGDGIVAPRITRCEANVCRGRATRSGEAQPSCTRTTADLRSRPYRARCPRSCRTRADHGGGGARSARALRLTFSAVSMKCSSADMIQQVS